MVYVNANLDQKTNKLLSTGTLTKKLADLCEAPLYVTYVAREKDFTNEAWREENNHFIRVVLPYEEVLTTNNLDLLAYRYLFRQLHLLDWLDVTEMKRRLTIMMAELED